MKRTFNYYTALYFVFFLTVSAIAQSGYTGSKKVFLDRSLCPADSSSALFYGWSYYFEGQELFGFKCRKNQRKLTISGGSEANHSPSELNGEFTFKTSDDILMEKHSYAHGKPTRIVSYNYGSTTSYYWTETFFFDSLYQNTPGSYYYETRTNTGELFMQGWFRDGEDGWKLYEFDYWKDVQIVDENTYFSIVRAVKSDLKYPYYGELIPPYIGFIGGVEGISYPSITAGVAFNAFESYFPRKTGSMIGGALMFRYNLPASAPDTVGQGLPTDIYLGNYMGIRAEVGNYSIFTYGAGYDLNFGGSNLTHAVTPFIGTSLYNFQLLLSYSFFSRNNNRIGVLRPGRLSLRYVIPLPRKNYTAKQ